MAMAAASPEVSRAWREEVFSSPPRRDIARESKATTRLPVLVPMQGCTFYGDGGNEHVALLLLRHLQAIGIVKRFKSQPFYLEELGGPSKLIPDILVELQDSSLHVIECKSSRFVTDAVKERFALERQCLADLGFRFHIWTNRDKVGQPISSTVRELDRGFKRPPPYETVNRITASVSSRTTLGDLLVNFGHDDVIGAAAVCAIHFDLRRQLHETSAITLLPSAEYQDYFFESRHVPDGWWASLSH
ncbi:MAG: Tn7 transposase TnsA N-terminal domain-containing protein [Burkholderiaceae bacterium]|nr:Tn7 transposase TnsA N-terminal domain-containing protein [Burkholderiaceae bacterium]